MKSFLVFLLAVAIAGVCVAVTIDGYPVQPVYNYQTGYQDYINNLRSTSIGLMVDVSTTGAVLGNCLVFNGTRWAPGSCGSTPPPAAAYLLLEDGARFLLEDDERFELE